MIGIRGPLGLLESVSLVRGFGFGIYARHLISFLISDDIHVYD